MSAAIVHFLGKTANQQTFDSSSTFTVPLGVTLLWLLGAGGGGGGAGGNSGGTLAGGGGAGAVPQLVPLQVSPGQVWTVTIGGGGNGGGLNNPGANGANSSFRRSGVGPTFCGAEGGKQGGGTLPSTSNGGRALTSVAQNADALDVDYTAFAEWNPNHVTYGGRGDAVNGGDGQAGQSGPYADGGAGGNGSDRGGGGGAGFGNGGNGSATNNGSATTGGRSAGGGGGGGAKAGASGGSGRIVVFW